MKPAEFYEKLNEKKVRCLLCPHMCLIPHDGVGKCRTRKNLHGELGSLNYAKIASLSLDPIEKKPLYHFHPGSMILSAGTFGCNLKCTFCQNWQISQTEAAATELTSGQLVEKALELRASGNIGIAYTYNEPSIWYEYVCETATLAHAKGLKNVLVTNGFLNEQPLQKLLPFIDAMNIDVKAFTDQFYYNVCKGNLGQVKDTVRLAASRCHVEVTTLVIPGLNDSEHEIGELAVWLSGISSKIPLHLSRFFPNYQMKDRPPTPVATLHKLRDIASEYLEYVYLGNV